MLSVEYRLMKSESTSQWGNGVLHFLVLALGGVCLLGHCLARARMEAGHRQFPVMEPRTIRSMAVIDFLHQHWAMPYLYLVVFVGSLIYLEWRNAPRWSQWVVFFFFALPAITYFIGCVRIGGKVISM